MAGEGGCEDGGDNTRATVLPLILVGLVNVRGVNTLGGWWELLGSDGARLAWSRARSQDEGHWNGTGGMGGMRLCKIVGLIHELFV